MARNMQGGGPAGAVYGLGFWVGVLGFLKAIVWPAILVFGAFKRLGM
jgi:hypothetical protein